MELIPAWPNLPKSHSMCQAITYVKARSRTKHRLHHWLFIDEPDGISQELLPWFYHFISLALPGYDQRHPDYLCLWFTLNFLENFSRTFIESFLERARVVYFPFSQVRSPYLLQDANEGFWTGISFLGLQNFRQMILHRVLNRTELAQIQRFKKLLWLSKADLIPPSTWKLTSWALLPKTCWILPPRFPHFIFDFVIKCVEVVCLLNSPSKAPTLGSMDMHYHWEWSDRLVSWHRHDSSLSKANIHRHRSISITAIMLDSYFLIIMEATSHSAAEI